MLMPALLRALLVVLSVPMALHAQAASSADCAATGPKRIPASGRPTAIDFAKFAQIVRVDTLPAGGRDGAINPRSIDVRSDGKVLFVEGRANRVTLRDRNLKNAVQLGRDGAGPGEYRYPTSGAFGTDGSIFVSDGDLSRVTQYNAAGKYTRTFTSVPTNIRALVPTSDGLLMTGILATRDGDVMATMLQPDGKTRWQGVPADPLLRQIRLIVDAVWGIAERPGSALVGANVTPSISRINTATGAVMCVGAVPTPVWVQLDPTKMPNTDDRKAAQMWIQRASSVQRVHVLTDGRVIAALERTPRTDETLNEWVIFTRALAPSMHVTNVPGRLALIHRDTLWIKDETEDGDVRISRAVLRGK